MRGKIYLYGCGGMGINGVSKMREHLINLPEDFAEVELRTLDTTSKTVQHHPDLRESFFKIESTLISDNELDGMGSERKNPKIIKEISKNIKSYMDSVVKEDKKNEYHILLFSSSGSSGNLIATLLLKEMLEQDFTAFPIVVADSSNLLYTNNTINTIAGLNSIAKRAGTSLPIAYFDNNYNGTTTPKSENSVNSDIERLLSVITLYTSGSIRDIDHQDMRNFFIPSRYDSITIDPGLYQLTASTGSLKDSNAILARTLLKSKDDDLEISVPLTHNKTGYVSEGQIEKFPLGSDIYPLFLTFNKNVINDKAAYLQERYNQLENLKVVNTTAIDGLTDSSEDDFGLIL